MSNGVIVDKSVDVNGNNVEGRKQQIARKIKEAGFGGKISANMVMRFPKDEFEVLVMDAMSDEQIGAELGIALSTANYLRRFYELPTTKEARARLVTGVETGKNEVAQADTDEADELMVAEMSEAKREEKRAKKAAKKEEAAAKRLAAPLVNGVAKHLDRMGDVGKVRVTVVVTVL